MIKKLMIVLFCLATGSTALAYTFADSFDDHGFTSANWQVDSPDWSMELIDGSQTPADYGYRGRYDEVNYEEAVVFAKRSMEFEGLSVRTMISVINRSIIEPTHSQPKDEGGTIFFFDRTTQKAVTASIKYSPGDGWLHGAGKMGEDDLENSVANLQFGEYYYLDFIIDQNRYLTSELRDSSNNLISTITQHIDYVIGSGVVGLASDSDAVFNDFSATSVPVPAAIWMFLSGLAVLTGSSRKIGRD